LEQLDRRKQELGQERIREVEAEWPRLIEQVEAEMEAGTDPTDERVQELARRWMELIEEFTGGDPGIRRSLGNVWQEEENVGGMDTAHMRDLMDYVGRPTRLREGVSSPPLLPRSPVGRRVRCLGGRKNGWPVYYVARTTDHPCSYTRSPPGMGPGPRGLPRTPFLGNRSTEDGRAG
jgi:hypothetical protein